MRTGMSCALRRQLSTSCLLGNEMISAQIPRNEIAKVLAELGLFPTYLSIVNERHFYQNKVLMEYAHKQPHPVLLRQLAGYGRALTRQKIVHSANFVRLELPIRLALRIRDLQRLPFNIVDNFHLTQIYENYYRLFDIFRRLPPVTKYDQNEEFCTMLSLMLDDNVLRLSHLMMGALEVSLLTEFTPSELDTFMSSMIRSRISRRLIIEEHISLSRSFEAEPQDLASKSPDYIGEIFKDCNAHDTLVAVSEILKDSLVQLFPDRDRMPDLIIDGDLSTRVRFLAPHLQYLFSEILRNSYEATILAHGKFPGKLPPIRITIVNDRKLAIFRISDQGGGMPHEKLANIWSFYKTPDLARRSLDCFHRIPGLELYANLEVGTNSSQLQAQPFSNTALADAVTKVEGETVHNTLHNLMVRPANYKLGLGLPMCKVYADYWNGDLSMNSLEGYGSDTCLTLLKLGLHSNVVQLDRA